MLPDRVSNPGPLTYESGALPIALRGPASFGGIKKKFHAISEIRTRDTWVLSPSRYPLRYGGQCNLQIKIINIC